MTDNKADKKARTVEPKQSNGWTWLKLSLAAGAILLIGNWLGISTGAAGRGAGPSLIGLIVVFIVIAIVIAIRLPKSQSLKALWPPREKTSKKAPVQPSTPVVDAVSTDPVYELGRKDFIKGNPKRTAIGSFDEESMKRYSKGFDDASAEHELASLLEGDDDAS